jgi:hypothetical protein
MNQNTNGAANDNSITTQGDTAKAIYDVLSPLVKSPEVLVFNGELYNPGMANKRIYSIQNSTRQALEVYIRAPGTGGTTWVSDAGKGSLTQQTVEAAYQLSMMSDAPVTTQGTTGKPIFTALSPLVSSPGVLTFDGKPYDATLAEHDYSAILIDGQTYGFAERPDHTTIWFYFDDGEHQMNEQDLAQAISVAVFTDAPDQD